MEGLDGKYEEEVTLTVEEFRSAIEERKGRGSRVLVLPGCLMAAVFGFVVDVPMITFLVIYKAPFMLFKGWQRLVEDLVGRSGPFLETVCVPFAGFLILLWPFVVLLAMLAGILSSIGYGVYAAVVAYQENSTKKGLLFAVASVSLFDEQTNDFLYLQEGSCFPRPKYREGVSNSSQLLPLKGLHEQLDAVHNKRQLMKTPSQKIKELKAVMVWDNFFKGCERTGEEHLTDSAIGILDLEEWQQSKSKIINIGIPACTFLQCFLQSIKSGSAGFLMSTKTPHYLEIVYIAYKNQFVLVHSLTTIHVISGDNVEITNLNRPEGRVFDWLFEPMCVMKEQIRSLKLSESEELYFCKLALYCGDMQRVEAWQNGGAAPDNEITRAQMDGICRSLIALAIFFKLWGGKLEKIKKTEAPEPPGAWPVIGHILQLAGRGPFFRLLGDMADKHGPIFKLRFGMCSTVIVSDWKIAKECFTTNDKVLASRPLSAASKYMGYNYAMFALTPYGSYWRAMRKIATFELLSNTRLEMLKHFRVTEINTCTKELYQLWVKNASKPVMVKMEQWFSNLTYNMVFLMVTGKRYIGTTNDNDKVEAQKYQKALIQSVRLVELSAAPESFPFLDYVDIGGYKKAMKKINTELDSVSSMWVKEHRQKRQHRVSGEGDKDFIDVMITILEGATELSDYDPDTIIKATILAIFLGGTDTTTVTLLWMLSLVLNNRDVVEKARDEMDNYIGRERQVEEADITNLPYLQAILKESMRLYPGSPLLLPHEAMENCTIGGFNVTAGTRVMVNAWKIQRDPRVWSDPLEFRPERFLTSHVDVNVRGQHFELIPFGSGRRSCPGITFALQVMQLTIARLIHGFEMTTPADMPVDMTPQNAGVTMSRETPLEVLFAPRLPLHLYE
ncbi:hypothetical protein GIB67_007085 [Kingdonia uniflora]|uniref:Cytochrome P450 n=1 Tax=Kingdonia uniflora TaxID=39325 RepID=A0A7J7P014_9MAGN|nr:hypothetical protein GIB67_007085 [Kingdonia uniflora]